MTTRLLAILLALASPVYTCAQQDELDDETDLPDLLRVYRATDDQRPTLVNNLGYQPDGKRPGYHLSLVGVDVRHAWFQEIGIRPGERSILYMTQNFSHYEQIRGMLVGPDYGFSRSEPAASGEEYFTRPDAEVLTYSQQEPGDDEMNYYVMIDHWGEEFVPCDPDPSQAAYHALVVSCSYANSTAGLDPLPYTNADAVELEQLLKSVGGFREVRRLEDPSRKELFRAIESYRGLTCDDNLLIFFSGHGAEDQAGTGSGYWIPADGGNDPLGWYWYEELRKELDAYSAGHVLVVSDACHGGRVFEECGGNNVVLTDIDYRRDEPEHCYQLRSRNALTSGNLEKVPAKSVMFRAMVDILRASAGKRLTGEDLFEQVHARMAGQGFNATRPEPKFGWLCRTRHVVGGDFVFDLRR